ncbi:MFS transporter [Alicyclobacillus fastidiosus]|uniref:MFS transporter n=1 Tax=Alicyclobacillus fastidiosus TaxID=392011 RepID=A0ABY6ZJF5_9BACL|nr:MFS transporter [Alicyclobacillus fastidiosus]WAH43069.1 MFS transporter [Alicyclobacillus fastidiosus]GMA65056.1 MFS transporter [Alicyclobacillus fastidiosus]
MNQPPRRELFNALPLKRVRDRQGYHWFVVGTVCVGAFMAALDASIINIALPVMKRDLHTSIGMVEWVSLSYILTLAAFIVPFSRLSDMFGRRWMYTMGFSVFIVGSFLCGFTPSLIFMFPARILQAVGAAMLQANSVSIITAATPSHARGKAIGIQASAQGVGLSLGPLIGGALITLVGWRWIFYVNVPVGIIGTMLGVLILPQDGKKSQRQKFDFLGAGLLGPTLVAIVYILNAGTQASWTSPAVVVSFIVVVVGGAAFYIIEHRVQSPMVDLKLFRSKVFSLGNLSGLLSFAVMYAVMFLEPFFLDNVRRLDALTSGLFLTAIPIGMTIFTPISGAISDRFGAQRPLVAGMVSATLGGCLLALTTVRYSVPTTLVGLLLVGVGMGVFTPPNNSQVMGSVPSNRLGITGGMLNMSRTLGMGLGVTLGGLSYQLFLQLQGVHGEALASYAQMIQAFRNVFIVIAAIAFTVSILSGVYSGDCKRDMKVTNVYRG